MFQGNIWKWFRPQKALTSSSCNDTHPSRDASRCPSPPLPLFGQMTLLRGGVGYVLNPPPPCSKNLIRMYPPLYMCQYGWIYSIFASKLNIVPWRRSFSWSAERGILGVEMDKWANWGSTAQKQPKWQGKSNKTTCGIILHFGLKTDKNDFKTGKKAKRTNGPIFRATCTHLFHTPVFSGGEVRVYKIWLPKTASMKDLDLLTCSPKSQDVRWSSAWSSIWPSGHVGYVARCLVCCLGYQKIPNDPSSSHPPPPNLQLKENQAVRHWAGRVTYRAACATTRG